MSYILRMVSQFIWFIQSVTDHWMRAWPVWPPMYDSPRVPGECPVYGDQLASVTGVSQSGPWLPSFYTIFLIHLPTPSYNQTPNRADRKHQFHCLAMWPLFSLVILRWDSGVSCLIVTSLQFDMWHNGRLQVSEIDIAIILFLQQTSLLSANCTELMVILY